MKGCLSKKLLSIGLSLALCATAVPMVSLSSSAAGTVTPKVAAGASHTVVLKADGSVWATGKNDKGQLGINETSTDVPKTATFTQCVDDTGATIKDATDIACGMNHTAVIRGSGELWQCGYNEYGQLGIGTSGSDADKPQFVQSKEKTSGNAITDAEAVACGSLHTAVIRAGGQLWQCGYNGSGQLGTETSGDKTKFEQSYDKTGAKITNAEAVACGDSHTAVIRANGQLWQCGRNFYGQLGIGTSGTDKPKFEKSQDKDGNAITDATAVACGGHHTAVIRAGGHLWQCGNNEYGQLGTGDSGTGKKEPKFVQSKEKTSGNAITDATAVACGYYHTAVIRANGQLWQCGSNGSGQLGTGGGTSTQFERSKDANGAITNVAAVSNGCFAPATLILRPNANGDLELLGAGANDNGQLGLGQENGQENYNSPQPIFIKSAIVDIKTVQLTDDIESRTFNVKGVGEFIGATSVTITWGDLTYNYNAKWDPATQTWVQNDSQEFWTVSSTDADKITATNNSSKAYKVVLSFKPDPAYEASKADGTKVEGSFVTTSFGADEITNNTLNLTAAEREKTAYLKLSGMSDKITGVEDLQNQTFGVVTATLQDPDVQQPNP